MSYRAAEPAVAHVGVHSETITVGVPWKGEISRDRCLFKYTRQTQTIKGALSWKEEKRRNST